MSNPVSDAAERLADLLARENAALAACDLAGAAAMLEAKQEAVAAFTEAMKEASGPAPQVRDVAARLADAAAENRRLLERGIALQGRVLAMIARAVPPIAPSSPYGAAGAMPSTRPSRASPMTLSVRA